VVVRQAKSVLQLHDTSSDEVRGVAEARAVGRHLWLHGLRTGRKHGQERDPCDLHTSKTQISDFF
jgi:hypothetical protein